MPLIKRFLPIPLLGLLVFMPFGCHLQTTRVSVSELRCEYRQNPEGIGAAKPRFGWKEISNDKNQSQTACQIVVSDSRGNTLWDSGRIKSDQSDGIVYAGRPLKAGEAYVWRVRLWDAHGRITAWSEQASFSTAISAWHAQWIGWDVPQVPGSFTTTGLPWVVSKGRRLGTLHLAKQIELPVQQKLSSATMVLFPDNACSATVNDQPAGEAVRWDQTTVLDVTRLFHPGTNSLALSVTNSDGLPSAVVGRVVLKYESGPDLDIPIDASWGDADSSARAPWGTPALNDQPRIPASYLRKEFPLI
jgi:alpha-L-rhamnosidase